MSRADSIISRLPAFFRSEDRQNVLYQYLEVFGKQVDLAEEDLIRVMRSHWVNTANNEDSKGFDTSEKGDLDKIFSLYVEALGGTSLLKQAGRRSGTEGLEDDKIYRTRIKGLIRVLREGPSTGEGINAIVAANLGIVGDSEAAQAARKTIRVEDFLPEAYPPQVFAQDLFQPFLIRNPNYVDTVPEFRIDLDFNLPVPLANPTLVNLETGASSRYEGVLLPGQRISFLTDGKGLVDGAEVVLTAPTPSARPGYNRYRLEGGYGMPMGAFDQGKWDFVRFEEAQVAYPGRFDELDTKYDQSVFTEGAPVIDITVNILHLTPGTFMVRIPWDIPGYSEVLDNLSDKPREQIPFIVEKVKAAGTFAVITYEKHFKEEHEMRSAFTVQDHMPLEDQGMEELNFDVNSSTTPYPGGLQHELGDTLHLSGVFGYTQFDSLNTFA